ncbi:MAG: flagellar FlbD family protein [bacterium]
MIESTRLDGTTFYVSPHQIEVIERTPDTVLCLVSGKRIIVEEPPEEIIDRIVEYRKRIGETPEIVNTGD